ncbi:MAG TPA: hypothetical protein V6C81_09090 [Planktothrix sp.]|jgi:hypothetical protein
MRRPNHDARIGAPMILPGNKSMLKYFSRVIRGLLATCLGLGGGVAMLVFIGMLTAKNNPNSFRFALEFGLFIGAFCAIFLGVVFLLLDLTARLFLAKDLTQDVWKLEQTREVGIEGTIKEITQACRQALLAVPNVKAVSDDMEHLITRARIAESWRSAGEEMEVEINADRSEEGLKWILRCTSKPRSTKIVFDYGKNFENVEVWRREFLLYMSGKPIEN